MWLRRSIQLIGGSWRTFYPDEAGFLETIGNNSIFMLILDNSHWSDEFTLDLLNFLVFRSSAAKLLIIISYRPCEDEPIARRIEPMGAELFALR